MAKASGPRTVQCYYCATRFEVGAAAMSVSCPGCYKPVHVSDVIVDKLRAVTELRTCGRIVVKRTGRVIARHVEAHEGVEVQGVMDANVVSGGEVRIGPKGQWKGDCRCPALIIESGARIFGGYFHFPTDPLKLSDLPGRQNVTPTRKKTARKTRRA